MELLIDLYYNSLIYYPNIFFLILFLGSVLGLFFLVKGLIIFNIKIKKIIREVNSELGQIKIGKLKSRKIHIIKFSPARIITNLFKLVIRVIMIPLSSINIFFKYLERMILKLVRRIGKEILID